MKKIDEMLEKAIEIRRGADKKNAENFKVVSKDRLNKNLEKKFRTTFIGNISTFEKFFGELWGHGKDYRDLTPTEKKWRKIWDTCRKEVLDKGNNELRAANNELSEYTVEWNRFVKKFVHISRLLD